MDRQRREQIEAIFEAALEKSADERAAFLADACRDDPALHAEVAALLEAHERDDGPLERPIAPAALPPSGGKSDGAAHSWSPRWTALVAAHLAAVTILVLTLLKLEYPPWVAALAAALGPLALPLVLWADRKLEAKRSGFRRGGEPLSASDSGLGAAGARVGHYLVLNQLGTGGMGVVHKAKDTRLDRYVALKFLPAALGADAEARERFMIEATATGSLGHPNICTIHEIGSTEDDRLYIALAYYRGNTLADLLAEGPISLETAVEFAIQIARGLGKAHEHGVVHRDVKPANVFVTDDGLAKILDFGVAKLGGVDLTDTGVTVGNIAYMSPEQIRNQPVSPLTDIWALGVVLYEMLAGEKPFRGDHRVAVLHAILKEEPPPLRTQRPSLRPQLERIVSGCLAKDPDERWPDMRRLIELLEGVRGAQTRGVTPRPVLREAARERIEVAPEGELRSASGTRVVQPPNDPDGCNDP